jgi:hypothetical protein
MWELIDYIYNLGLNFDDLMIFISLNVGLIILVQINQKVASKNAVASIIRFLVRVAAGILIFAGILYWRLRTAQNALPGLETFAVSLDIVLAHAVLTVPFLFESLYISSRVANIILFILALVLAIPVLLVGLLALLIIKLRPNTGNSFEWVSDLLIILLVRLLPLLQIILTILSALGTMWLLFIGTRGLQMFLFGAYDESLGWNYPTQFRFTNLFSHIEGALQGLNSNETLSIIITFLAIAVSVILLIGASAEAIKHIGEGFTKDENQEKLIQAVEKMTQLMDNNRR